MTCVSLAAAMLLNLLLFFFLNFLTAPADVNQWVRFYFGQYNGMYFVAVTILLALPITLMTRNMNIVMRK